MTQLQINHVCDLFSFLLPAWRPRPYLLAPLAKKSSQWTLKRGMGNTQEKRWEILLLQQCNLKRPPASFLYLPGLWGGFIREIMGLTGSPRHITTRLNILKFYCCVCVRLHDM